jgi:hypothetical protein
MKSADLRMCVMLIAVTICTQSLGAPAVISAQVPQQNSPEPEQTTEFRPQLVPFEVQVLNVQARGGIEIDFKGTTLMPNATGSVRAKLSSGSTSIKAEFENLESPTKFGEQNLVYILWTMTRESPIKLGELVLKASRGSLDTKTALQTLALFATVEPYLEVIRPSNLVVLEQTMAVSKPEANTGMTIKTELLRDGYVPIGYTFEPLNVAIGQPSVFRQALNARRIAQTAGAAQYAPQEFKRAENLYQFVLGDVLSDKRPTTDTLKNATTVIRYYESARATAVRRQTERRPVNQ